MSNILHNSYIKYLEIKKLSKIFKYNQIEKKLYSEYNSYNISDNGHLFGIYDKENKIWYHAWGLNYIILYDIKYINNRFFEKSKKLLLWALDMDISYTNDFEDICYNSIVKNLITQSKYIIENDYQLDIIVSLITYLLKCEIVVINDNNVLYEKNSENKNNNLLYYYGFTNLID